MGSRQTFRSTDRARTLFGVIKTQGGAEFLQVGEDRVGQGILAPGAAGA